jgi:hypothetical protein
MTPTPNLSRIRSYRHLPHGVSVGASSEGKYLRRPWLHPTWLHLKTTFEAQRFVQQTHNCNREFPGVMDALTHWVVVFMKNAVFVSGLVEFLFSP